MPKQLPSGLYFVALILFFTPWWSAGCSGHKFISLTGVQTVTGFKMDAPALTDPYRATGDTKEIPPDPLSALACLLTFSALITGLKARRKFLFAAGAMGFAAAVLLLAFKARVDAKVLEVGSGLILGSFENGFWATLIVLFTAATCQLLIAKQLEPELGPDPATPEIIPTIIPANNTPAPRKSRAVLIPTEPPPAKHQNDLKFMPPAMRAEMDKTKKITE